MDASKEACQDRRERVKALGADVVPAVKPMRKVESGSPSSSAVPPARDGEESLRVIFFRGLRRPSRIEYSDLSSAGYSGAVQRSKLGRVGFGQDVRFRRRGDELLGCSAKLTS